MIKRLDLYKNMVFMLRKKNIIKTKQREINIEELSCENTIEQVCQWMKRNKLLHYELGDVLNQVLGVEKFTTFCGRRLDGLNENIDMVFIIEDYSGNRDISKENIVLTIEYKEGLIFSGRYILKDKGNIRVKELGQSILQ